MTPLCLCLGGMLGAFARALFSDTQAWRSQRTVADVIVGGFVGILTPWVLSGITLVGLPMPIKAPSTLTPWDWGAVAAVLAFIGNWATTLAGWKLGWFSRSRP